MCIMLDAEYNNHSLVAASAVAGVTGPMAAGLLSAVAACAVLLL